MNAGGTGTPAGRDAPGSSGDPRDPGARTPADRVASPATTGAGTHAPGTGVGSGAAAGQRPARPTRPDRPRVPRTDRLTTVWMVLGVVAMAVGLGLHGVLPQPLWTMVHVATLGILSNAILQWSWYFARALLHLPPGDRHSGRDNTVRILVFNVALVVLVAGMWRGWIPATITGATLVGLVIAWHGVALVVAARNRLASRFAVVIRYYVAAAAHLVIGATLAGFMTVAMFDAAAPAWLLGARDGLTVAHALVGVGGWIGLTMAGTLVTLGPTILRTRMAPDTVRQALGALPVMVVGILGAATCAVGGWMGGVGAGVLVATLAALVGIALPLVRAALAKPPAAHPSWSTAAGLVWILAGAVGVGVNALRSSDATALRDADLSWLPVVGAGGLLQVLVGALSYLMPVVIGGGPSVVRTGIAELERWAPARLVARNAALVLLSATMAVSALAPQGDVGTAGSAGAAGAAAGTASALPVDPGLLGAARTLWWVLVLATFVLDIVLFARAGIVQARASREARARGVQPPPLAQLPPPTGGNLLRMGAGRATGQRPTESATATARNDTATPLTDDDDHPGDSDV